MISCKRPHFLYSNITKYRAVVAIRAAEPPNSHIPWKRVPKFPYSHINNETWLAHVENGLGVGAIVRKETSKLQVAWFGFLVRTSYPMFYMNLRSTTRVDIRHVHGQVDLTCLNQYFFKYHSKVRFLLIRWFVWQLTKQRTRNEGGFKEIDYFVVQRAETQLFWEPSHFGDYNSNFDIRMGAGISLYPPAACYEVSWEGMRVASVAS